jgi:hypothetical protein
MTLRLNGSASGYTELEAAPVAGNNKITLPASSGSSGQILKNSNGVLDWSQIRENADGSISLVAGTAAAPSLSFTGDLNTGIYSPGADQVAISTGGSGRLFVDASGNIGIGVSSPQEIIHASGNIRLVNGAGFASANSLISKIGSFAGSANQFDVVQIGFLTGSFSDQGQITFSTNNSSGIAERMRITQAGLVGIGTSSPSYKLDVQGGVISAGNGTIYGGIGYSTRPEIGSLSNHDCGFMTNSTTRMLLDTSGRLGIGTTSLNAKLVVSTNNENFEFSPATTTFNGGVLEYLNRNTNTTRPDLNYYLGSTTGGSHKFWTDGTERARIDSSGRLLVGTSSARSNFYNSSSYSPRLQLESANDGASSSIALISVSGGGFDEPNLVFAKSRGSAIGNNTIVVDGDDIGNISFQASDGSEFVVAASILAEVDGTPGANDMPGRLVFSTTADGASSPTERMRISNGGTVSITGNQAGLFKLYVSNQASTSTDGCIETDMASGANSTSASHLRSTTQGVGVWALRGNGSSTWTSDERKKKNIETTRDGYLEDLCQLRVVKYNWAVDDDSAPKELGLIAQEVEQVFPRLVMEDVQMEGDTFNLKVLKASVLPYMLLKALQEAATKIETLEAKVAALEAQ